MLMKSSAKLDGKVNVQNLNFEFYLVDAHVVSELRVLVAAEVEKMECPYVARRDAFIWSTPSSGAIEYQWKGRALDFMVIISNRGYQTTLTYPPHDAYREMDANSGELMHARCILHRCIELDCVSVCV